MTAQESLEKARSNEEVALLLFDNEKWDWVVTVSFYSAVHLVEGQIFPREIDWAGKSIPVASLDEYAVRLLGKGRVDHKVRSAAVGIGLKGARAAYDQLSDLSQNARYDDYHTCEKEAKKALKLLAEIRELCPKSLNPTSHRSPSHPDGG
jgi:uncharacterized protein (UPF0332 family)